MLMKFFSLQEGSLFSIHDPTGHPVQVARWFPWLIILKQNRKRSI